MLLLVSCKKNETELQIDRSDSNSVMATLTSGCDTHPIIDNMPGYNTSTDTTELPTILGSQRNNPYTLSRMRTAYDNLGYASLQVNATDLYVRFLPNSASQLSALDSIMDSQNLELFDAPMDYDVLQEGNYYQDPSIPDTSVTWQYAVVPTNFQAPAGITYEVLSQIHIPGDDYTAMETEAERLASIQDSIDCSGGGAGPSAKIIQPNFPQCPLDYHWDLTAQECVCNCCPTGYHWIGNRCVQDAPPPPPPPATDAQVPAGNITVSDNNLGTTPGVRILRVVAKRWFKVERGYTDNNGHFQFTKRFKHTVKINVKFKNTYCNIRGIRGIRLWQSLYVINRSIGVYGSNKSFVAYNFDRIATTTNTIGNRFWAAASTFNAVLEQRDYSVTFGFSAPPLGLNIYLTNWGISEGLASTPLFGKRFVSDLPASYINTLLVGQASSLVGFYVSFFAQVARMRLDMAIDYHRANMNDFTSDFIKGTVYHELCHASHYTQAGTNWYTDFVNAELAEIENHPSGDLNPYGDGTTGNSPIIALGEGWGYHIGHFLADQRYGVNASCTSEQTGANGFGIDFCPNSPFFTIHPHIDVLEQFNPNLASDPFRWIPKGLMEDLMDNTNETRPPQAVNDAIGGYTIQQIFNALQSDIQSPQQYRDRFLQQNGFNQQVINLFIEYHYN